MAPAVIVRSRPTPQHLQREDIAIVLLLLALPDFVSPVLVLDGVVEPGVSAAFRFLGFLGAAHGRGDRFGLGVGGRFLHPVSGIRLFRGLRPGRRRQKTADEQGRHAKHVDSVPQRAPRIHSCPSAHDQVDDRRQRNEAGPKNDSPSKKRSEGFYARTHEVAMNCEDMMVAILKDEQGVLDETVRHDVEAHLAICEDCAQMAALGEALAALKRDAPRAIPSSEGLSRTHRSRAMRAVGLATALIVAFPGLQWLLGASTLVVAVSAGMSIAAMIAVWAIVRKRQSRFHRLASSGQFLMLLRQHLEEDLLASKRAPIHGVILLAMGGAMSAVEGTSCLFLLIAGAMITGVGLYLRARAVPQLRAELAELAEHG